MNIINIEKEVISAMIDIYCAKHHIKDSSGTCNECEELKAYAFKKLENCPFKERKPECKDCHIHCYTKEMRDKIKQVMRYSGPRLLFHSPIIWFKFKLIRIYFSHFKKIRYPIKSI